MPNFRYKARNIDGEAVKGVMEALSIENLEQRLASNNYYLIEAREIKGKGGEFLSLKVSSPFGKVGTRDVILFSRQLASMLHAGIPITGALEALKEQTEKPVFKSIIGNLKDDIERGKSFADALSKHPQAFSTLYIATIRVGEETGNLDAILIRLANFLEREADTKAKIRSALLYPALLIFVAGALITFLVTFVLPRFRIVFMESGVPLPLPTQMMFNFSEFVRRWWFLGIVLIISIFVGWKLAYRSEEGKFRLDKFKLKLPIFGILLRKVAISRFSHSLETLVGSGVDIIKSFQIIKETIGNEVLARVMDTVRENMERGGDVNTPLRKSGEFPPMVVHMIFVGEQTGTLADMLKEIADSYEKEVDYAIKNMIAVLEPALLVVMGCIVTFIALSLYMPLFRMAQVISASA
ncbi:MAG TPA: type II secretion system F family protein [Candidatus Omnitrophica bacterium]|nr:type II secretion system F family protein [Candidatus Omnitrophota bacterium]